MKAAEFLEVFSATRGDAAVLASSGISGALWRYGHRPRSLYNTGMSYATAACAGIAFTRPDQLCIALEGDGSYLMGLPTLATVGRYAPANLCVVVFNNHTYLASGTSGELRSAAAFACDLGGYARAAGIDRVFDCSTAAELVTAMRSATDGSGASVVIADVDVEREGWDLGDRSRPIPSRAAGVMAFQSELGAPTANRAAGPAALDVRREPEYLAGAEGWASGAIIYEALRDAGVDFAVYLPESLLYPIQVMIERDPAMFAICCTREDEGVAIAGGAALAGRTAALVCEGTGVGMSASSLAGLITRQTPIIVLSSHSRALGIRRPWDEIAAMANEPILRALGMSVAVLDSASAAPVALRDSVREARITSKPVAVVLPPQVMDAV